MTATDPTGQTAARTQVPPMLQSGVATGRGNGVEVDALFDAVDARQAAPVVEGLDPSDSFETARPVHVEHSAHLRELHAAADRYFVLWLETGAAADIAHAAELAEQARQLEAKP